MKNTFLNEGVRLKSSTVFGLNGEESQTQMAVLRAATGGSNAFNC